MDADRAWLGLREPAAALCSYKLENITPGWCSLLPPPTYHAQAVNIHTDLIQYKCTYLSSQCSHIHNSPTLMTCRFTLTSSQVMVHTFAPTKSQTQNPVAEATKRVYLDWLQLTPLRTHLSFCSFSHLKWNRMDEVTSKASFKKWPVVDAKKSMQFPESASRGKSLTPHWISPKD